VTQNVTRLDLSSVGNIPNYHYSTSQLLNIHDDLMFETITPLVDHTLLLEKYMPLILGKIGTMPRRKFTNSLDTLPSLIMLFLLNTGTGEKVKLVEMMKLERNLVHRLYSQSEHHLNALKLNPKDKEAREALCVMPHRVLDLLGTYHQTTYLFKTFTTFRNDITLQYYNRAFSVSGKVASTKKWVDTAELHSLLILYVYKAIDKIDTSQGTLTNYINLWWQHAINKASNFEYGVAYVMPNSYRKKNVGTNQVANLSIPLDHAKNVGEEDADYEMTEDHPYLKSLIALADPTGMYRLAKLHVS